MPPPGTLDLEPLALPRGPAVLDLLPRLSRALAGGGPILPHAEGTPPPALPVDLHRPAWPDDLAVAVGTSGSTGTPKRALLGSRALTASIGATNARLGLGRTDDHAAPQFLLAVPPHHIAGLQVIFRSLLAGTTPVVMDLSHGFTARAFARAVAELDPDRPWVTSLVPTQVVTILDDPHLPHLLARFHSVLVGGSSVSPWLRTRATRDGIRLVTSYGMSETAGGCVYDGMPLAGVTIETDADGRVLLSGPMLAHGYLGRPDLTDASFGVDTDGQRWFRTDDLGHLDAAGRLHVDGRVDDLINTGGVKVAPRLVEEALLELLPGVREAVVIGTPDRHWGEAVSAVLVLAPDAVKRTLRVEDLRAALRGAVADHALPRRCRVVDRLPMAGPGKPDRRALAALFSVGE